MRRRLSAGLALFLLALLLTSTSSFGWGESAERLITNKAIDTLPDEMLPFFVANRQFIVQHSADVSEVNDKSPGPHNNDFVQIDHYGPFPFAALPRSYSAAVSKYSRRTIEQYGLLPWQIGLYSKRLTDDFRSRNWVESKLTAAQLAHYVAAAHDPFNTTTNSDGNLSGQPGVNERYSSGLIDRYQLFFFVRPNEAAFINDPTDHAFEMVLSAHSQLEPILLSDRLASEGDKSHSDEYYDRFYAQAGAILVRQLSEASTDVGSYWMTAWINAGRPQLPAQ
jgi:hypothetical protein